VAKNDERPELLGHTDGVPASNGISDTTPKQSKIKKHNRHDFEDENICSEYSIYYNGRSRVSEEMSQTT
jgi:hypothetical protein